MSEPIAEPKEQKEELTEEQLREVAGGLNPQPLPPRQVHD
jgi:hypothetical protein